MIRAIMQTDRGQRFYHSELDSLRFIAFLLVFIHNANPILKGTFLETFSAYSWFGVDLFFCLSAFLITKLLAEEQRQTGRITAQKFFLRRILRICPLYFFYILAGMVIFAPMEGRNINIPGHLASLATFTFNAGYFALLPSPILIFIHLWSISYEAQFYALAPWLVRRLAPRDDLPVLRLLGFAYAAGSLIRALFILLQVRHPAIYFLPFTHFDALIGGTLLGLGRLDHVLDRIPGSAIRAVGFICLGAVFLLPNNDVTGWGLMLTYPLTGLAACLLTYPKQDPLHRLMQHPVLASLGKISYGLYVFHFGSFLLATNLLANALGVAALPYPRYTLPVLVFALAITILLSTLSYNFLEKPFLRLKARFGPTPTHAG